MANNPTLLPVLRFTVPSYSLCCSSAIKGVTELVWILSWHSRFSHWINKEFRIVYYHRSYDDDMERGENAGFGLELKKACGMCLPAQQPSII